MFHPENPLGLGLLRENELSEEIVGPLAGCSRGCLGVSAVVVHSVAVHGILDLADTVEGLRQGGALPRFRNLRCGQRNEGNDED